jgi:hypothetical protein
MAKKEKIKKPKRPKGNGMFAQFRQQAKFLKEVDPKAMPVGILFASIAFVVLVVVGALVSNGLPLKAFSKNPGSAAFHSTVLV